MYDLLIQLLRESPVTTHPRIVDLMVYGQNAFKVKIRATVTSSLSFQIWLNCNPWHVRYAYQLFGPVGPVLRWDNAPHYPHLTKNYPHHLHDQAGHVSSSSLQGDPLKDLPVVLREVACYLAVLP